MSTGPLIVSSGKRIEDVAAEYKDELRKALAPVVGILNRAGEEGIVLTLSIGRDQYGKFGAINIDAVKPL